MTIDDNTLDVRNLTKRFGPIVAVDDLSFSVAQGEIFGFLGPNGAGKTTTIRMLTGLLTPDAGEIRVQGTDVHRDPIRAKMAMGIIPEMSNVYIELTARQNVVLAGRFYGKRRARLKRRLIGCSRSLNSTIGRMIAFWGFRRA